MWTAAEGCCAKCKRLTQYHDGFQVDHIVPLYKGGEDIETNCQVLCINCHDKKTMKDMGLKERLEFDMQGRVKW